MKYIIIDWTANTGREYIDENGENCELEENARVFDSKEEARETIINNCWEEWASVIPK